MDMLILFFILLKFPLSSLHCCLSIPSLISPITKKKGKKKLQFTWMYSQQKGQNPCLASGRGLNNIHK